VEGDFNTLEEESLEAYFLEVTNNSVNHPFLDIAVSVIILD